VGARVFVEGMVVGLGGLGVVVEFEFLRRSLDPGFELRSNFPHACEPWTTNLHLRDSTHNAMKLQHIALAGLTPYTRASALQAALVRRHLAAKAQRSLAPPSIITAQFHPVYTSGRRETVSAAQQAYLRASGRAEYAAAARGGQTTFHGPGQLVAYPIVDLRRHGLSPRCYVHALEGAAMRTCARYGVATVRTENVGVWTTPERKIAAVGVHLRRFVSAHGVGLNVSTDLWWFGRIVACGLADKEATSLEREGVVGVTVEEVGEVFVEEFASGLDGVDGVVRVSEEEVLAAGVEETSSETGGS